MPPISKKQSKKELLSPKQRHSLLSITRFIFSSDYIRIRIWLLIIPLIIFLIAGSMITNMDALIIVIIILGYFLLSHLHKWLEKQEEK